MPMIALLTYGFQIQLVIVLETNMFYYLCLGILWTFSMAHKHDCPKGSWQRAGSNLCIHLDHGEPDDFQGALEHCRDDSKNEDPKRDWAHLITVKDLLEILSQPARHFSHEIWINAVLYDLQWYQIMKVPLKPESTSIKDYIDAGYAVAIGNDRP